MSDAHILPEKRIKVKRALWLDELEAFLIRSLAEEEGTPVLDVRFLLKRIQDTQGYKGQIRDASFRELSKELKETNEIYPSFLPLRLLTPPEE
jgi:hypothetical protein